MQEFFTRQSANEGIKLELSLPDGKPSDHWIRIRGVDSDEFRKADTTVKRKALEVSQITNEIERQEKFGDLSRELLASLFIDWSFEEELTIDNVMRLLKEAPQIADTVNKLSAKRSAFVTKK